LLTTVTLFIKLSLPEERTTVLQLSQHSSVIDIDTFCYLQLGWHPVAVIRYTFTHKQYTEQHNETVNDDTRSRLLHQP